MNLHNLACCGNDCSLCPRHVATRSRDEAELARVAELWQRVGWRTTLATPAEMACRGCAEVDWCRYGIKPCAQARGEENCGQCLGYPCSLVQDALARTETYARTCREKCTPAEYQALEKAFFRKRDNLESICRAKQAR